MYGDFDGQKTTHRSMAGRRFKRLPAEIASDGLIRPGFCGWPVGLKILSSHAL
jgi:hypothetical protein